MTKSDIVSVTFLKTLPIGMPGNETGLRESGSPRMQGLVLTMRGLSKTVVCEERSDQIPRRWIFMMVE
ncbi:hypothetical protein AFERRI_580019 [Acidithiobacillus ferrivorans]|nr:hypothetical protein AFERRI_520001 [Acidithiobacillus ferrivorans]CDQ11686.1 hypothetical protein AFERRI_580019 [Acidithiobacillus ferrivorans]